ncbi:hypothetical protein Csa_001933 [Cucumis sativus]|uniref:Uncharacterized protein n=1 Tax=Cucumis sativus TaxID=3659 RepID=A0A0A0L9P7_CUCSA|nr:hypothetical protein Csa_001933 [Cucumis sativus]
MDVIFLLHTRIGASLEMISQLVVISDWLELNVRGSYIVRSGNHQSWSLEHVVDDDFCWSEVVVIVEVGRIELSNWKQ